MWNSKHLSICTKVRVYNAVVLPSLLCGCQTWSTYVRHVKRLEAFHQRCLRDMMSTRWWQCVPNSVVLERANLPKIETYLKGYLVRWHLGRMEMIDYRNVFCLVSSSWVSGSWVSGSRVNLSKDGRTVLQEI